MGLYINKSAKPLVSGHFAAWSDRSKSVRPRQKWLHSPWHNLVLSAYMLSSIGMKTTCDVRNYVDSSFFFGTTQGTRELNLSNLFILKKLNATLSELFVSFYKVLYHSCISELTAKRPELLSPTFVIKTVLLLLFSCHACCPRVMCRQMLI